MKDEIEWTKMMEVYMMDDKIIEQVFEKCCEYFGTSMNGLERIKEFGEGKSGNRVFLIEVFESSDTKKNGRYVIKISNGETDEFLDEILNTVELGNLQEQVNGLHFPNYKTAGKVAGTLYYIYDVAGSELGNTIDLSGQMLTGESVLEKLSRVLLLEWNEKFSNSRVAISECIKGMIGENV